VLQFRALEAACAALCAGRATFANPLAALHDHHAHSSPHAPDDARTASTRAAKAPAGLLCGACGSGTRRGAASFAAQPAFLCRRCHALNVFSAPGVEVHVHQQERTAAGVLHFITVDRGCDASSAPDCVGEATVSYPVFNASRKVVLGARESFDAAQRSSAAGVDAGGAAAPLLPRAGCAEAADLPPHAPPLVVRCRGDDGDVRVFLERTTQGRAAVGVWEELRDRTAPEQLPAFCAAVMGVAHGASDAAAELAL